MEVRWKQGTQFKAEADKAYAVVEKIRAKEGSVSAESVVEAARLQRNPLHGDFEWDAAYADFSTR